MGLLISLLWAVTEDNEFCTLGEKLRNHFSTTPIPASDGESAWSFQFVSKGAASSACAQLKAIITKPKSSLFWRKLTEVKQMRAWKHACLLFTLCVPITLFSLFLQNFTFNDDFSPSSTSSADLSGLGAEPKTPGLSQSLALSSDEVLERHHGRAVFMSHFLHFPPWGDIWW